MHPFSKISWKFLNRLPKLNFKYFKRTIYLVFKYVILWHSEQRHMIKFVVLFDPSIDRTKESLLLLAFFQYWDKSNIYETFTSGRRRVLQQISSVAAFTSSTFFIRKSSEHEGISTLPCLIKSSMELETDLFAFLRNEELFQGKKLHCVCKLTKGYHHAKEERIWLFWALLFICDFVWFLCGFALKYCSQSQHEMTFWLLILAPPWKTNTNANIGSLPPNWCLNKSLLLVLNSTKKLFGRFLKTSYFF